MPRKPKHLKPDKQAITVVVNDTPIIVYLHPPTASRKTWYVYWNGLTTSRTTGQRQLENAIVAAEKMVKNGGKLANLVDACISDDEFEEIQRTHFGRKQDEKARKRSASSLESCLDAIAAFREITGLQPITLATPDDCANFQRTMLLLPKDWRKKPLHQRKPVSYYRQTTGEANVEYRTYSPNTILKYTRELQAAFERTNRNAPKRKCVRGVVPENKLLRSNPWTKFNWIEGREKPIRHFDNDELLAVLDYFESAWSGITVAPLLAKFLMWSWGRRIEVPSLEWTDLRIIGSEYHFDMTGKWGVQKWFRIPEGLYRQSLSIRNGNSFVFSPYCDQLRLYHEKRRQFAKARNVLADFDPENLANWFYKKLKQWSKTSNDGLATTHIFRKTSLQHARNGEDVNRQVSLDARLSESVMLSNYVKEEDEQLRHKSNRTYHRILASLSLEVARRYGYLEEETGPIEKQLEAAVKSKEWALASELAAQLQRHCKS